MTPPSARLHNAQGPQCRRPMICFFKGEFETTLSEAADVAKVVGGHVDYDAYRREHFLRIAVRERGCRPFQPQTRTEMWHSQPNLYNEPLVLHLRLPCVNTNVDA